MMSLVNTLYHTIHTCQYTPNTLLSKPANGVKWPPEVEVRELQHALIAQNKSFLKGFVYYAENPNKIYNVWPMNHIQEVL